jgi:hypothetical protein
VLGEGLGREREMLWRESTRPNMLSSDEIWVVIAGEIWRCSGGGGPTRTRTWDRPIMSRML